MASEISKLTEGNSQIRIKENTLKSKEIMSSSKENLGNFISLAIATCGVGYIPLIPGTIASAAAALAYFFIASAETNLLDSLVKNGYEKTKIILWFNAINSLCFLCLCILGIWAAGKAAKIFETKDPKQVVIDEVIGQFIAFTLLPLVTSWKIIFLGFVIFRFFDVFKPYPINYLQNLPDGFGICADDILAGVYTGIIITFIYAFIS